jgi:hypothetical protein
VTHHEQRYPKRVGEGFDTLAGIEHRTVTRDDVSHDPQVDHGVIGDPSIPPRSDHDHDDGNG